MLSVRSEYYGGDDGGMSDRREGVRGGDADTEGSADLELEVRSG